MVTNASGTIDLALLKHPSSLSLEMIMTHQQLGQSTLNALISPHHMSKLPGLHGTSGRLQVTLKLLIMSMPSFKISWACLQMRDQHIPNKHNITPVILMQTKLQG